MIELSTIKPNPKNPRQISIKKQINEKLEELLSLMYDSAKETGQPVAVKAEGTQYFQGKEVNYSAIIRVNVS